MSVHDEVNSSVDKRTHRTTEGEVAIEGSVGGRRERIVNHHVIDNQVKL